MSQQGKAMIDASLYYQMIASGTHHLANNKRTVDNLNVFPVPDGDTGTNMSMTMASSFRFLEKLGEQAKLSDMVQEVARGALMGARGNSGVILSQVLRGFSEAWKNYEALDAQALVEGFTLGADAAYKAVSSPMEGTVLTVVREAAEAAEKALQHEATVENVLKRYIEAGYQSLAKTPDLLPVLKQAGVVDAGGQGFLTILDGMALAFFGTAIEEEITIEKTDGLSSDPDEMFDHFFVDPESIVYPYCTEFLLQAPGNTIDHTEEIRSYLADKGDCMLVVGTPETVKVHVHTATPGAVLQHCSQFGELDDIKINNMRSQNRALQDKGNDLHLERVPLGVVAVANGQGMEAIFQATGAIGIVHGGQTMNPSTEDFLKAIDDVPADAVVLLPNNKNVIMSAEQAAAISEKDVAVVPSKTMPQGISALFEFNPELSLEENKESMMQGLQNVRSGEITTAVRDTVVEGVQIREGAFLAIVEGKIIDAVATLQEALETMVRHMTEDGEGLVTLYRGKDVSEEEAAQLEQALIEGFSEIEFESHDGLQQVYHYIVSAE